MDEALVKQVFADEEFVKGLFQLDTPQEVQAALREKNIELSVDEIVKIRDVLVKKFESGGELSDEELEMVSGGLISELVAGIVLISAALTAFGVVVGAGGGLVAGAAVTLTVTKAW